jgi:hypothetical protein
VAGDLATFEAPLRKLFGSDDVRVLSSSHAALTFIGMSPDTRALFRWSGRAVVDRAEHDWSLILKVWRRDPKTDDPGHWNYWKREFLAYGSGILDALPGISAPRLFGTTDEGDVVFAWLEEVRSDVDARWPSERYVTAALHLGRFNGAYSADRPLPDAPFLTRSYLRGWTNWLPWADAVRAEETWSHPLVAAAFPTPPVARLQRLHAMVPTLFDRLEALPQTFSHLDAWRANLIATRSSSGDEATTAVDWSFVGTAPIGQEVAILVGGSHIWLDAEPDELASLSPRAFGAYVEGLREAGWRGDERVVRFAYAASTALYLALLPLWIARNSARREWLERKCRRPVQEVVRGWAILLDHALELADEAYELDALLGGSLSPAH